MGDMADDLELRELGKTPWPKNASAKEEEFDFENMTPPEKSDALCEFFGENWIDAGGGGVEDFIDANNSDFGVIEIPNEDEDDDEDKEGAIYMTCCGIRYEEEWGIYCPNCS